MFYDQRKIGQTASSSRLNSIYVTYNTPLCKNINLKFGEYKLLDDQIERVAEGMDRMNARPQDRQNPQK